MPRSKAEDNLNHEDQSEKPIENNGDLDQLKVDPPADDRLDSKVKKTAKVRVKSETIKGIKIIVGKDTIQADDNGIIEVDAEQAEMLLTIPGYMKA